MFIRRFWILPCSFYTDISKCFFLNCFGWHIYYQVYAHLLRSQSHFFSLITDRKKGNVFTGVCHSVHNWPHGFSVTVHPRYSAIGTGMLYCFRYWIRLWIELFMFTYCSVYFFSETSSSHTHLSHHGTTYLRADTPNNSVAGMLLYERLQFKLLWLLKNVPVTNFHVDCYSIKGKLCKRFSYLRNDRFAEYETSIYTSQRIETTWCKNDAEWDSDRKKKNISWWSTYGRYEK